MEIILNEYFLRLKYTLFKTIVFLIKHIFQVNKNLISSKNFALDNKNHR